MSYLFHNLAKRLVVGGLLILAIFSGPPLYAQWLMNRAFIEYASVMVQAPDSAVEQAAQEDLYRAYVQASNYKPGFRRHPQYRLLPLLISGASAKHSLHGICPESGRDYLYLILLRRTGTYVRAHRYDEAEAWLGRLAELCPNSFEVFKGWATLKEMRGDYGAAIRFLETAITLEPQVPHIDYRQPDQLSSVWRNVALGRAHSDIGNLYAKMGQYDRAIATLESSIARYPPGTISPWLYNLIGVMCYDSGYLDKSKWAFEEGLKIDPNLPEAPMYLEWIEQKIGARSQ